MAKVKTRPITYLVPGRIPHHSVTIIEGRKSTGKSSILAALAAYVTGGPALPETRRTKTPQDVIWLAAEETAEQHIRPRLEYAGADLDRVHDLKPDPKTGLTRRLTLPACLEELDALTERYPIGMLICDPYSSFVPAGIDMRQEADARSVMEPLAAWSSARKVDVILSRHLKKGRSGPAIDAGLGGVGVGNVARAILRCDMHPDGGGLRTLSYVAGNCGGGGATLTYKIEVDRTLARVRWVGTDRIDADTLAEAGGDAGARDVRGDALLLLQELLATDWVPYNDIFMEAKTAGIGETTLRSAKAELGVQRRRVKRGLRVCWEWGPPLAGWAPAAKKVTGRRSAGSRGTKV